MTGSITASARYHDGVLKPEHPLALREGESVRLTIESVEGGHADPERILALARAVYAGLTPREIESIESVSLDRSKFSLGRL